MYFVCCLICIPGVAVLDARTHQSRTIKHTYTVTATPHLSQGQEVLTKKKSPCTPKYQGNRPLTNSTKYKTMYQFSNDTKMKHKRRRTIVKTIIIKPLKKVISSKPTIIRNLKTLVENHYMFMKTLVSLTITQKSKGRRTDTLCSQNPRHF